MIRATGVKYHQILSEVDIELPRGELTALVGPNGAGKSTLLALLAGDLRPTAGSILIDGRAVHTIPPRELARLRAVMPQSSPMSFAFTCAEIVAMALPAHASIQSVHAALDKVDAAHLAARRFPTLSGGEQARVTLARVLAQDTPVVLLDEPTAHLDIRHQHTVLGIARDLANSGRSVVAVLHDLNLAARYADQVVVMQDGRLASISTPAQLTDEMLTCVYQHPIEVVEHPKHKHLLCLPG